MNYKNINVGNREIISVLFCTASDTMSSLIIIGMLSEVLTNPFDAEYLLLLAFALIIFSALGVYSRKKLSQSVSYEVGVEVFNYIKSILKKSKREMDNVNLISWPKLLFLNGKVPLLNIISDSISILLVSIYLFYELGVKADVVAIFLVIYLWFFYREMQKKTFSRKVDSVSETLKEFGYRVNSYLRMDFFAKYAAYKENKLDILINTLDSHTSALRHLYNSTYLPKYKLEILLGMVVIVGLSGHYFEIYQIVPSSIIILFVGVLRLYPFVARIKGSIYSLNTIQLPSQNKVDLFYNENDKDVTLAPRLVILGESGAGKTTLARSILSKLEGEDKKLIYLDGSTKDKDTSKEIPFFLNERMEKVLKEFGLTKNMQPRSHGEIQRYLCAEAISDAPEVLILDEAFSGVQYDLKTKIMKFLYESEINMIIVITHNPIKDSKWSVVKI